MDDPYFATGNPNLLQLMQTENQEQEERITHILHSPAGLSHTAVDWPSQ